MNRFPSAFAIVLGIFIVISSLVPARDDHWLSLALGLGVAMTGIARLVMTREDDGKRGE